MLDLKKGNSHYDKRREFQRKQIGGIECENTQSSLLTQILLERVRDPIKAYWQEVLLLSFFLGLDIAILAMKAFLLLYAYVGTKPLEPM